MCLLVSHCKSTTHLVIGVFVYVTLYKYNTLIVTGVFVDVALDNTLSYWCVCWCHTVQHAQLLVCLLMSHCTTHSVTGVFVDVTRYNTLSYWCVCWCHTVQHTQLLVCLLMSHCTSTTHLVTGVFVDVTTYNTLSYWYIFWSHYTHTHSTIKHIIDVCFMHKYTNIMLIFMTTQIIMFTNNVIAIISTTDSL